MPRRLGVPNELIRKIIANEGASAAKRKLVAMGKDAVEPVLDAMTGTHGRFHPERHDDSIDILLKVLIEIAKKDVGHLAEAMAHHVPGLNAVAWAIGHSKSRHAQDIMKDLTDHEDSALQSIAEHHLRKAGRAKPKKRKSSYGKSKAKKKSKSQKKKRKKKR